MKNIIDNLRLASMDVKFWKVKYITKQRKKNPNISNEELNKKITNAKRSYFRNRHKEFDEAIIEDLQNIRKS